MKKFRINLSVLALLLGTGAAFASSPANNMATLYGYDQATGQWIQPRAGSRCNTNPSQNCEAQFNGDPNSGGTIVPGTLVKGNFVY